MGSTCCLLQLINHKLLRWIKVNQLITWLRLIMGSFHMRLLTSIENTLLMNAVLIIARWILLIHLQKLLTLLKSLFLRRKTSNLKMIMKDLSKSSKKFSTQWQKFHNMMTWVASTTRCLNQWQLWTRIANSLLSLILKILKTRSLWEELLHLMLRDRVKKEQL